MTTSPWQLLDPTTDARVEVAHLAPRLRTLEGKIVGLYANQKINSVELMDLVELEIKSRFDVAGFVRGVYNAGRVMRPNEWGAIDECDAVLLTHGD